ncbi:armadillo repeat-containing protein 12 isoform X1 [Sphaerodactylus townsendi]|uniref:armadillo repeat-containing protein 12 isoform X1 n=1 Tax=Sphaerodactylus townsendi TaxID=933632 RepID=UPI00202707DE|nr:armadillo repeat-containing protein 12 isoform X1 [Sphaerodactylus townsendi]
MFHRDLQNSVGTVKYRVTVTLLHNSGLSHTEVWQRGLAVEQQIQNAAVSDSGELRGLLLSLHPKLDDYAKKMVLHGITRCVYLLDKEASACTYDDIVQVASFLDDQDMGIRIQTLNALKAFAGIWKFKIKNQEFVPKILEMIASFWDNDMHIAGLRLLNGLQLPAQAHSLLKKLMPSLMDILQLGSPAAQVQVLKFLSMLAQKEDLLYSIMNCQVQAEFLNLFQPSHPGNLLFEMLVFVERLSEGRLTPHYQSVNWQYNELSLHEVLFGEDSRLSDCLLSLIIHPEEEVQIQACRVILKLQLSTDTEISIVSETDSSLSSFLFDSIGNTTVAESRLSQC